MKPKRHPRRVANPLLLVAGMQNVGQQGMLDVTLPFLMHLHEIAQGHGHGSSVRIMTIMLAAAHDAAMHYRLNALQRIVDHAGDLWIRAGERCSEKGITSRVVLNGEELEAMRKVIWSLCDTLPEMQAGAWHSFWANGARRWDQYVAQSAFKRVMA